MMSGYTFRAMEVHDFTQIWNLDEIRRRLDFMVRNGMNALVFHEPGIEDKIVFPAKFLGGSGNPDSYYDAFLEVDHAILYHALRENLNLNRRDYINHVIREAREAGVDVYFENKELWFSDFVLKYRKELMQQDGTICPSDPFWYEEFLPYKYKELFLALPDLAGIICSIGTGEARLAISNTFACGCDRCKNLDPVEWYKNMILGMYKPFKEAGKKLIIRDFIYTKAEQERFQKAFIDMPEDIVLSLKNTPHDFYPTFPDNPLMGQVGSHPQITEYDVNGQFFGWGAQPSAMLSDIRRRLRYGKEHNVTGFLARTDWEGVQDWTCFDNLNMVNLYAIAACAEDENISDEAIYLKWLEGEHMLRENLTPGELKSCIGRMKEWLDETWPIVEKTNFVNGCLFSNDSCIHLTPDQFTFIGGTHHSLSEWDPEKKDALEMSAENIRKIIGDKEWAREKCEKLADQVSSGNPGLTEEAYDKVKEHFEFMRWYVRGFRLTARGYCFGRYVREKDGNDVIAEGKTAAELLKENIQEMECYREKLCTMPFIHTYPFDAQLNPERVDFYIQALKKMSGGTAR
ncbi:hypothetical protein [Lachnoclostridium sp. An169]|uniref:hypothetical protein n=1 Tax=Lachnoclostridium sp. An169 TaxID=1965569 RepID=UPI0011240A79|nr:hypothetical protein [Lachnoclostridium sp. An169]